MLDISHQSPQSDYAMVANLRGRGMMWECYTRTSHFRPLRLMKLYRAVPDSQRKENLPNL